MRICFAQLLFAAVHELLISLLVQQLLFRFLCIGEHETVGVGLLGPVLLGHLPLLHYRFPLLVELHPLQADGLAQVRLLPHHLLAALAPRHHPARVVVHPPLELGHRLLFVLLRREVGLDFVPPVDYVLRLALSANDGLLLGLNYAFPEPALQLLR